MELIESGEAVDDGSMHSLVFALLVRLLAFVLFFAMALYLRIMMPQSALCRAAVPQAPALIARMGANCPAAVPCLLVGCVTVYQQAHYYHDAVHSSKRQKSTIAAVCVNAVRQLANLSSREAHRALALLRRQQQEDGRCYCMLELQLELAMKQDSLAAACLLIQHLSLSFKPARLSSSKESPSQVDAAPVAARRKSMVNEADSFSSLVEGNKSSLRAHLEENLDLLARTLQFLCDALSINTVPLGRVCIFVTAYTRLLTRVPMERLAKSVSLEGPAKVLACLGMLRHLLESLRKRVEDGVDTLSTTSQLDRAYDLLVVALLSTASVLLSIEDFAEPNFGAQDNAANLLRQVLTLRGVSRSTHVLVTRIALALKYSDPRSICDAVELTLASFEDDETLTSGSSSSSCNDHFVDHLAKLCEWASANDIIDGSLKGDDVYTGEEATADPSIALQLMECNDVPDAIKTTTARDLLNRVLVDEKAAFLFLRKGPLAVAFVDSASSLLLKGQGPKLPLVLPVQIEVLASTIRLYDMRTPGKRESLFLVQLLYCFSFLEREPSSSFKFDPRALPLKQIYLCCESPALQIVNKHMASRLKDCIDRYCAEVQRAKRYLTLKSREQSLLASPVLLTPAEGRKLELLKLLRKSAAEPHVDPCGLIAEKAFVIASSYLSDADLFSVGASALLSRPSSPPLFFTYPMLYRDPLAVLKCPLNVWSRRGTRRIALMVLTNVLDINDLVVGEDEASDDVLAEFIACRNELVVKSLMSVATSSSMKPIYQCGMTCGLVRKMVARHEGLVALLIKQGLNDSELDWMIESVPELAQDALALRGVLTDRSSLTAAERLVAADGILRIAIAHGHMHTGDAEALTYAALAQLVASFFLIVGPVGVPVNTLVGEGTGLDATQVSRKTAFRMLNALQKVRGYRTRLKNDCSIALQKFAGMCKGESIVAGRQKTLLKDLLESVGKALDAMGSGIQI